MTPFEQLLSALGAKLGIDLAPDPRQSCRLDFGSGASVQIDLDSTGDQILIGATLGRLSPGIYREQVLKQALRANAMMRTPRGTLAYSERNDNLILFQYFSLAHVTPDDLSTFLPLFHEYASVWMAALKDGGIPSLEDEIRETKTGFMGLR